VGERNDKTDVTYCDDNDIKEVRDTLHPSCLAPKERKVEVM
jgi:hypothetical protein